MTAQPRRRASHGELRERGVVALVLFVVALAVTFSDVFARIDHLVFDFGQRLGQRLATDDVVIVAVDEESLARIGRWPWSRSVHARALQAICRSDPAVVGFDVAFSEPGPERAADADLANAVADCRRVVLPLVIETAHVGGQLLESPPIPGLAAAAAGIGRVGVRLGEAGIARSVDLREGVGVASWPLFAAELLRVSGRQSVPPVLAVPSVGEVHELVRQDERRIAYAGPPGSIPRISFAQVLDGNVPRATFAGKTVLIGATAVGLGDFLPTPVSARAQPMPGVEVQGNVFLSLRDGRLSRPLPLWASALCCAVLALLPLLWLPRLMPLAGLGASLCWMLLLVGGSAWQAAWLPVFIAPSGAFAAGLLAFPLWSWHRLEAARRHLDQELRRLAERLGADRAVSADAVQRMGFEERIASVQAAQNRLQTLEMQRNEALAFISHDLRTPLASVVQRLESEPLVASTKLLPSLRRTQAMAQDFLHTARAEALEPERMAELDLVSLLEQAADELYPVAAAQGRKILRSLPEDPVWIKGDFAALERCAINLLQNALNYAPDGEAIRLEVNTSGGDTGEVRFCVVNSGREFSVQERRLLFQRYQRGDGSAGQPQGAGLGLYFVRTVAEKHGGHADVECRDGLVCFRVSLPAMKCAPVVDA